MMNKWKWFTDFSKEEAFLDQMALDGWQLAGVSGLRYRFVSAAPTGEPHRIDYRSFKSRQAFDEYLTLFADSGWRHVAGSRGSGAQYFVRAEGAGEDNDIFSDNASRAGRYRRLGSSLNTTLMCYLVILFSFAQSDMIDLEAILHPQSLYYTPGLWELSGWAFWRAFLFETPFALGRGFLWLVLLVGIVISAVLWLRAWRLGKRQ